MEWFYFLATAESTGKVLIIARRNGPFIQTLTSEGAWVDKPNLLPRFWDPGFFEEVTDEEAHAAAKALRIEWAA